MSICYKQAKNTFLAYIYAYIAENFISSYMISRKTFFIIDFDTWAYRYGDIVWLLSKAYLKKNDKLLKEAREAFNNHKISYSEVQRIVNNSSIGSGEIAINIDNSLLKDLEELHKRPWKDITLLPAIDTLKAKSCKTYVHYKKEDKNQLTT
ncbi:hypothetical protein EUA76_01765, partial [TM7 phylum sp. oral taxon 350]